MRRTKGSKPPQLAEMVLGWLLKDDWQTPLGDFEEYYNELAIKRGKTPWHGGGIVLRSSNWYPSDSMRKRIGVQLC